MLGRHEDYKAKPVDEIEELAKLYRKLSLHLEVLQSMEDFFDYAEQRVFSAVLEEDLTSLLEECEECLLLSEPLEIHQYCDLKARGETVLEEVIEVVSRQSWETTVPSHQSHALFSISQ